LRRFAPWVSATTANPGAVTARSDAAARPRERGYCARGCERLRWLLWRFNGAQRRKADRPPAAMRPQGRVSEDIALADASV
jgi:hypothetical protein